MNDGTRSHPTLPRKRGRKKEEGSPAITTSSKTAKVIASGFTAKVSTAGKLQRRAGSCTACLREFFRVSSRENVNERVCRACCNH